MPASISVQRTADGLLVKLQDGGNLAVDAVLCATGRVPNVEGLGLEDAGVAQGADGAVLVDEHYRTSVPSIHAVGDVTARVQLTPIALAEAMVVVDQLFGPAAGKAPRALSYDFIPTAVFTHPNVGTVGMTEAEARAEFGAVRIFRSEFKALKHTLSGSSERTLMKLIVDAAHGSRRRTAHGRRRCRRDRPGLCRRDEGRGDQGSVRRHRRHPPDGGRGVRHDACAGGFSALARVPQ